MEKLLILLFVCHWLADFTHLSTPWMLKAKQVGSPLFPIFVHAMIHGTLMFIVLLFFAPINLVLLLVPFQLITHFFIDVLKGKINFWFPVLANTTNKFHWWLFGFDQLLHQTVIVIMAWAVFNCNI